MEIGNTNKHNSFIIKTATSGEKYATHGAICNSLTVDNRTYKNFYNIMEKGHDKIQELMKRIKIIYQKLTNKRRGLIDGLDTMAKALFGTMDANDDKLINKQLSLLHDENAVI